MTIALGYPKGDLGAIEYRFDDLVVFLADGAAKAYLGALDREELEVPADTLLEAARRTSLVDVVSVRTRLHDLTRAVEAAAARPDDDERLDAVLGLGVHTADLVLHQLIDPTTVDVIDELADGIIDGRTRSRNTIGELAAKAMLLLTGA